MGDLTGVMSTVFKRIPIGGSAAVFKVGVLPSRRKNNQVGDQVGKKPGFFGAQKKLSVFFLMYGDSGTLHLLDCF